MARGYALCATQRSGSTFLSQVLTSTGVLGRPTDFFNAAGRREKGWSDYPEAPDEQLDLILEHGATPNGVYGFKVFPEHLDALDALGWTDRLPGLDWLYLRRDDVLGRAISLVRAAQTGSWRSTTAARGTPAYDAGAIRDALVKLAAEDARWQAYFAERGIRPLELTYDALVADPQGCADAVARRLGHETPVKVDLASVEVAVQRDELNADWRARFLREAPAAAVRRRPRLTVSILAKDAETTLPRLLAEAAEYADEVIVGVDAASTDDTLDVAAAGADVVYRFALERPGQLAPARLLPFEYATGDWILSLDDDESMEASFDALAGELMEASGVTHYWFPRKWIVNDDPWEYVHAPPWFPNWAPRMFRNDRSLVWKPAQPHSMYNVLGPSSYESRTSILHYEPLWCPPEKRDAKLAAYRDAGASDRSEAHYAIPPDAPRRPVTPRARPSAARRRAAGRVDPAVRELVVPGLPPWRSEIGPVDMAASARAGETVIAQVTARNTGTLAWWPTYAQLPARGWPLIRLSYRLFDANDVLLGEGERTLLPRVVTPGDEVTFIAELTAPAQPGDYTLEWDIVSEGDCWFSQCGGNVARRPLAVHAAQPEIHRAEPHRARATGGRLRRFGRWLRRT